MKRTTTYAVCDGCGKSTLEDGIEIVRSRGKHTWAEADSIAADKTIDICNECSDKDCYICQYCRDVHSDEHLCEFLRREHDSGSPSCGASFLDGPGTD